MNLIFVFVCDVSDDDGTWTQMKSGVRFPTQNLEVSVANALAQKQAVSGSTLAAQQISERRGSVTSLSLKQHTARCRHRREEVSASAILD